MVYNNGPSPLILTRNNDPSLWRTNSYVKRLQERRNATRMRKNRPSITNKIKSWFGRPGVTAKRTRKARRRANTPRIMYE